MSEPPVFVAYGGGVNSTAMLVGLAERGERVDLIVFSDTGGERPETYRYVRDFSKWLVSQGMPGVSIVRKVDASGDVVSLEEDLLRRGDLPSLAYGFKRCSTSFKKQPQEKLINNWEKAKGAWSRGERVVKLVGFDVDEEHRAARPSSEDGKYEFRFPLIEWGWDREQCAKAIEGAGLSSPGKSSCFFCPAMKGKEILSLPCDLKERALAIERGAKESTASGLGRRFKWEDLIRDDARQMTLNMDHFTPDIACECVD